MHNLDEEVSVREESLIWHIQKRKTSSTLDSNFVQNHVCELFRYGEKEVEVQRCFYRIFSLPGISKYAKACSKSRNLGHGPCIAETHQLPLVLSLKNQQKYCSVSNAVSEVISVYHNVNENCRKIHLVSDDDADQKLWTLKSKMSSAVCESFKEILHPLIFLSDLDAPYVHQ